MQAVVSYSELIDHRGREDMGFAQGRAVSVVLLNAAEESAAVSDAEKRGRDGGRLLADAEAIESRVPG